MIEMLVLLVQMRCLLDTLTLCHSWQKWKLVLNIRVVILRGRVSIWHFLLRGVLISEGCSEDVVLISDIFILVHRSCDHYWHTLYLSSLYVDVCFFHLSLHVLFLFFLYTHGSYYLYEIYYFYFTQRCLDEFCLKYFKNTGCQSLLAINFLLVKFFKSVC